MKVVNKDGIETYLIQELPDGKVEIGFSTCNAKKVYAKTAFLSGNTSDYIKVPSGQDFVQYHTGERRRQSNGNIAVVIGGTGKTLLVKDEVTGAQVKSSYKAFYDGNAFGTGVVKTSEQWINQENRKREKSQRTKSEYEFSIEAEFNGVEILSFGNSKKGYIPCIEVEDDRYRVYNLDDKKEYVVTEDDMTKKLNRLRSSRAHWTFDANFFVGTKMILKPFNLPCTIIRSSLDTKESELSAWVSLDGTKLECKVDMEDPYVNLQTFGTEMKDRCTFSGHFYKETQAGLLFKFNMRYTPLLLRNIRLENGTYLVDVTHKVSGTDNETKTKTVTFEEFKKYHRSLMDEIKRMDEF